MSGLHHLCSRPWMLPVAGISLVASHGILFYLLRRSSIPHVAASGTLVSGVVLLMIAKHLGLLAGLLRSLHALFRRRS